MLHRHARVQSACPGRYHLLDAAARGSRGGAAELARETLELAMDTAARILPTEAARLVPPLAQVLLRVMADRSSCPTGSAAS